MVKQRDREALLEFLSYTGWINPVTEKRIESQLRDIAKTWRSRSLAELCLEFKTAGIFPESDISVCSSWLAPGNVDVDIRGVTGKVGKALGWFAKRGHPQTGLPYHVSRSEDSGRVEYQLSPTEDSTRVELAFWPDTDGGNCHKVKVGEKSVPIYEFQCDGERKRPDHE